MLLRFGRTRGLWCFSGSVSADRTFSRCAGRETSFPLLWTATHPLAVTQEPGKDGVCAQKCLGPAEKQPGLSCASWREPLSCPRISTSPLRRRWLSHTLPGLQDSDSAHIRKEQGTLWLRVRGATFLLFSFSFRAGHWDPVLLSSKEG